MESVLTCGMGHRGNATTGVEGDAPQTTKHTPVALPVTNAPCSARANGRVISETCRPADRPDGRRGDASKGGRSAAGQQECDRNGAKTFADVSASNSERAVRGAARSRGGQWQSWRSVAVTDRQVNIRHKKQHVRIPCGTNKNGASNASHAVPMLVFERPKGFRPEGTPLCFHTGNKALHEGYLDPSDTTLKWRTIS